MGGIFGLVAPKNKIFSMEEASSIKKSIRLIRQRGLYKYTLFTNNLKEVTEDYNYIENQLTELNNTSFIIFNSLNYDEYENIKNSDYPIAFDGEIYKYNDRTITELIEEAQTKEEDKTIFLIKKFMSKTDGVWSAAIEGSEGIYLFRDVIGVKPLWYGISENLFVFSSERKAIWNLKLKAYPVIPRDIISYNIEKSKISVYRNLIRFSPPKKFETNKEKIRENILKLMENSIRKRFKDRHIAILFSGGVDSTFLSLLAKKLGYDVRGYCLKVGDSKDYLISKEVASKIGIELKVVEPDKKKIEENIKRVIKIIEDYNPIRVTVASALYPVMNEIRNDMYDTAMSGNGAEEIFIGYKKYQELLNYGSTAVTEATIKGIENIWMRDIYRDDLLSSSLNLNTKLPFLDIDVVKYSIAVEPKLKIDKKWKKLILRELAEKIGVPKDVAWRKKLAAQYGTGIMKTITKISKSRGYKYLVDYFYDVFRNIYQSRL